MDHPSDDMSDESDSGDVAVDISTLETEDGTQPEVGDDVQVDVQGKVSRIEGNCAYVTPETCNGQPPPSMDSGNDAESLRNQAQQADESDY